MEQSEPPSLLSPMLEAARGFIEGEHPLFKSLALKTTRLSEGEVCFRLTVPEDYLDGDHIHGGIFTIMLDTILGYSVWTSLDTFRPIATINLKTDYFGHVTPETTLICSGVCEGIRDEIAYCTGRATTEETGELIATATGTFMVGTRSMTSKSRL